MLTAEDHSFYAVYVFEMLLSVELSFLFFVFTKVTVAL